MRRPDVCQLPRVGSSQSARDRDRLRQEQLERQGWRFHRIWSSEWFYDKDTCAAKAVAAYHDAVRMADEDQPTKPPLPAQAAEPQPVPTPAPAPQRARARPPVFTGLPISDYSDTELTLLAHWIRSDGVLRTEEELLDEMMRELGFQRRGKNVVARITEAIRRTRR